MKQIIKKISNKLGAGLRSLKTVFTLRHIAIALAAAAVVSGVGLPPKSYNLVVALQYGPELIVHESLLVTSVVRRNDGSVCFERVQDGRQGCIKTPHYYLIEQNIQ